MLKVGITGGMGCGKSSVTRLLERSAFRVLDSDQIVRTEVLQDRVVVDALRARYGSAVLDAAGAVDRPALARTVFASDPERQWLEELVHPRVFAAWRNAFETDLHASWAVEVPLLFEKGLENWFDFTVCVALDPESQLARLERRGLSRTLAGQRISKQLPLTRKIELSDFVLWNAGTPEFLQSQVDRLAEALATA